VPSTDALYAENCIGLRMFNLIKREKATFAAWRRLSPVLLVAIEKQVIRADAPPNGITIPLGDLEDFLRVMKRLYRLGGNGHHRN